MLEGPSRCLLLNELDSLGKKHCLQHYIIGNVPGMSVIMSLGSGGWEGYLFFFFFNVVCIFRVGPFSML